MHPPGWGLHPQAWSPSTGSLPKPNSVPTKLRYRSRSAQFLRLGSFAPDGRDIADSLAVFAAPKRIGLKSHIRVSGCAGKIVFELRHPTSQRIFGRADLPWGWIFVETPLSAISRSNWSL